MTTLQDLITLIRQRSNTETNQFVIDDELTSYINNSLSELDDVLVATYDEYKITSYLSSLVNGQSLIPLPEDFLKLRGVDYSPQLPQDNNGWYTINLFQFPERNRYNNAVQNVISPWGKVTLSARVMGNDIMIVPQDEAGGEYQIWYTPKFTPLVNPTDLLPLYMDSQAWIEFTVCDVAGMVLDKMNLDSSGFMTRKIQAKDRVMSAAKNRNSSGPKRVANVRFTNDFWPNNFSGW